MAENLLEAGHEVVGVDNLNDAYDPRLKQWRLARLLGPAGFRFHELDIADRTAVERALRKRCLRRRPQRSRAALCGGDQSGRPGGRPGERRESLGLLRGELHGTLNLLDACRQYGVRKFVLASTSSLYGSHNPVPYREDADTNRPLSPYAASKKAAETLAYTYHHLHGLDVTVFRYFTVYGPAGRPDMSVFRFIRRIAEGEPIVVFGDGTQERDFTYVDDIARGTIAGLEPLGYEVINLGGDRPVRLSAIIDQIAAAGGQAAADRLPPRPSGRRARHLGRRHQGPQAARLVARRCRSKRAFAARSQWYRENRQAVLPLELGDR